MTGKSDGFIIWERHMARDQNLLVGTPLLNDFLGGNLLNGRIDMPQPYRILIGNFNEGSTT